MAANVAEVMMKGLIAIVLLLAPAFATAQVWSSGATRTDVVELYTSEGCSSCPPADRWLSSLQSREGLFDDFVPMAFHVDYWDYIGWTDVFAKPEFSQRQRQYVREGLVSQTYTPGIVINSMEWRQWFRGQRNWTPSTEEVGRLEVRLQGADRLTARFEGKGAGRLNVAVLGMGLTSIVSAGENRGRELSHDFVVLKMVSVSGEGEWELPLPRAPEVGQQRLVLAAWVTPADSQAILQAVGGYIEQE